MKKCYSSPELEIRKYAVAQSEYVTTSNVEENKDNGLFNDDKYDYFG
jgi:hypothetical protein